MSILEAKSRQLCTFHVGELFCGIDVTRVQEVLRHQGMTPVPLASPVISGLINLRGQIVTAIDLRRMMGLAPRSADALAMNVVVRTNDSVVSLFVDEIGDVIDVEGAQFEAPPVTLNAQSKELILGVYKLSERVLLLLDTDLAVRGSELGVSEGTVRAAR